MLHLTMFTLGTAGHCTRQTVFALITAAHCTGTHY
jgi:hypothetical protein